MKRWLFTLLGIVYAISYLLVALFTSGGGHGPRFTFAPILYRGIGLLVFPVLAFFITDLRNAPIRIAYALLLLVYNAGVFSLVCFWWTDDLPHAHAAWAASPMNILIPVGWYFAGQSILWGVFARSLFPGNLEAPSNTSLDRSGDSATRNLNGPAQLV